jgi:lipopolysaccharide export system protein LptC
MQRRTLLLFALFVVTAWFYSSLAQNSSETVAQRHQTQYQLLNEADEAFSVKPGTARENESG